MTHGSVKTTGPHVGEAAAAAWQRTAGPGGGTLSRGGGGEGACPKRHSQFRTVQRGCAGVRLVWKQRGTGKG